ncbi:hypothetical protein [Pararobbsia silviterrae]|uniref:hypothetical protein n=1 Tax=Pararobbsia silviterrae TaxID=1792498 RepID=UPI0011C3FA8C|nr:hypothetical protein [Pararobbsia silviterrae]
MEANWSYGAVAFVDILGFSALVTADSNSIQPNHLEKLRALLGKVKEASQGLDIRAFSDCIVISAPLKSDRVTLLFNSVISLQRLLVGGGVLVRGGVAFGKHFADDTLIYSEALIRAYLLERDKARFPRILVDPDLLDWYFHNNDTTPENTNATKSLLLTDRDNQIFLNYLQHQTLDEHLTTIKTYNTNNATPSVLEKIQWLGQYHNYIAKITNSDHVFSGPMLDGFREIMISP